MRFHKILCPVDFSPSSHLALEAAADLARADDVSLVILHVWQSPVWAIPGEVAISPQVLQDMVDGAHSELASWRQQARELGAKEVTTRCVQGVPWDRIVEAAREDRAIDLIVMGTHGRTGLGHALLGSVAEKTVRHAPCAVLIARANDRS